MNKHDLNKILNEIRNSTDILLFSAVYMSLWYTEYNKPSILNLLFRNSEHTHNSNLKELTHIILNTIKYKKNTRKLLSRLILDSSFLYTLHYNLTNPKRNKTKNKTNILFNINSKNLIIYKDLSEYNFNLFSPQKLVIPTKYKDISSIISKLINLNKDLSYEKQLVKRLLTQRIYNQLQLNLNAFNYLYTGKYDCALVVGDSYGTGLALSVASRLLNMPCIHIHHGLDCDPFCYDQAWASTQVVWGQNRIERYNNTSYLPFESYISTPLKYSSLEKQVTINYPKLNPQLNAVFLTRPHNLHKCYIPNQTQAQGVDLAKEIQKQLPNLTIVPHGEDNIIKYKEKGFKISSLTYQESINQADIVISEESTALIDSLLMQKPTYFIGLDNKTLPLEKLNIPFLYHPIEGKRNFNLTSLISNISIPLNQQIKYQC